MPRTYFRPIKDDTIISTLHHLRQVAVRDGLSTLPHIDAILLAHGVDPETLQTPRKTPKAFKRGELHRLVLDVLRSGPQTGRQIAEHINAQRPSLTPAQAYKRVYICLNTLKRHGVVDHEGRVWKNRSGNGHSPGVQVCAPVAPDGRCEGA